MSTSSYNTSLTGQFPRLSDRFRVEGLAVKCTVPNNRKMFGKKVEQIDMMIVDLSIAGALLLGPKIAEIRAGSKVPFTHNGEEGIAQIRHVRAAHDVPKMKNPAYYGVVFVEIPSQLKEMIFGQMAANRGKNVPELDELWNHAR
ncbi:MAG: hypothetical protein HKN03_04085 [Acidimicrobiales bacterium]|nr:hypothetical protein [Acidimicrobiales bacterium]